MDLNYKIGDNLPKSEDYSPEINSAIQNFMNKNGISSRKEAIKILKENGKL